MTRDPLLRAWMALIVLSLGSTLIATGLPLPRAMAGGLLLVLAWAKARAILNRFLGLEAAPGWARGFSGVIGAYLVLLGGLALAG